MGRGSQSLNYMHVGSFFVSKLTQSGGIAAIILKQWGFEWYWYAIVPVLVVLSFIGAGWIGVKTGLWERYMREQFKGSLINRDTPTKQKEH